MSERFSNIAIEIGLAAKEHGWQRFSLIGGERFFRADVAVHVWYAVDGRVLCAYFYRGPDRDQIKGGKAAVIAKLKRFGV